MNGRDLDGAWGIAIVQSIMDGSGIKVRDIASYLKVPKEEFLDAHQRLSLNGCFLNGAAAIKSDQGLRERDVLAWGYYAGYASGATRR